MKKSFSLREVRVNMGLTQVQLANMLGITPEYLSMVERGSKHMSAKLILKLNELTTETKEFVDSVQDNSVVTSLRGEIERLKEERDYLRDQLAELIKRMPQAKPFHGAVPAYGVGYVAEDGDGKREAK